MLVRCKSASHIAFPNKLTRHKNYEVIEESGIQYKILDDEGEETWWAKERFFETTFFGHITTFGEVEAENTTLNKVLQKYSGKKIRLTFEILD